MTGPPDLADLTFDDTKVQSVHINGSRILKRRGISILLETVSDNPHETDGKRSVVPHDL